MDLHRLARMHIPWCMLKSLPCFKQQSRVNITLVLKLYESPYSTYTARVTIVLHEIQKNIPELVPIDLGKGQRVYGRTMAVKRVKNKMCTTLRFASSQL